MPDFFPVLALSPSVVKPTILLLPRCMKYRRGLAMRILSVRPSVCPSVCHTRDPWQNGRKIGPDLYTIRKNIYPSFLEEEWLVGATPSTWNFRSTDPHWSEIADFQPIIDCSAWAVTPSEKSSINANRKSTTRFPMSLIWSKYVAAKFPKEGLKNAKRLISIKKCTSLEESLLQSFFVWKLSATKL